MHRALLLVAALPALAAEELFSTAQCDTWAYMAGCPEGRVAVQNECWLLSSPDAPSCGEACGGDAFVDVAGTQARGSQTEVVGCLEHGFLDGRHIRAQHLHLIPQQMNELNRPCAGVYSYEPLIDTWHCYTWYATLRNSEQFSAILRDSRKFCAPSASPTAVRTAMPQVLAASRGGAHPRGLNPRTN